MTCPGQRILIVKPSSLGDIVHALPVLAALRSAHPSAHIAWLTNTTFAPLLEGHPLLDEVIPFDRARYGRMWRSPRALAAFVGFLRGLYRRRFDLVLDLQGLFRSGFLSLASGARTRVGFSSAREFAWLFCNHPIQVPSDVPHAVDRNLHLAAALGLDVRTPAFPLAIRPEEHRAARVLLSEAAGTEIPSFTAILPGARWETKRWPADRWAKLIDGLHADNHPPCVLLGSRDDRPRADQIAASCTAPLINLVGRTSLRQLAALLDLSTSVICQDSGPMHMAAALQKPIVAVFGPTDPRRVGPYCPTATIVSTVVECSPCTRRACDHHSCLRLLEVEQVLSAVRAQSRPRQAETRVSAQRFPSGAAAADSPRASRFRPDQPTLARKR